MKPRLRKSLFLVSFGHRRGGQGRCESVSRLGGEQRMLTFSPPAA
jgi:hypothetical protein